MARVNGIKALFSSNTISQVLEQFKSDVEDKLLETLQYVGEEFVNKARSNNTYRDRTGNLRSSIGYIILLDGKVIDSNFEGKSASGKSKGKDVAKEVGSEYTEGYVLIGVAGMNYAAYVEAKGFDVITGAAPEAELLKSILNEI